MILWLLFLSLLSISTATPSCCADDDYWSCDEGVTCSCSNFKDACYFTNGPESDPGTCYIYATCGCCIVGNNQQYDNFCKDCSCKNFTGAAYTTSMDGYCYVYEPPDEVGCCNNLWEFEFGNNPFINYTCKAAPGLCKINTEDGCWVMGPCSYEGCCLVEDSIFDSPTSSCSNFSGSTNFTIEDSDDFVCWVFAPSIDVVGGCGCANATGNCTCESSSLSCNLTFFDGTWGNIPPGSGVVYKYFPDGLEDPVTELYYCPLSYDPPAIAITIVCLVVSGALTLCYLARKTDPEFFQATNIWKKFYRLGTILNMFWPAVHMSITLGYLYWLMSSQTFAPIQVSTSKSDSSDKTDNTDQTDNSDQTPYYMLVNANWYAQYNGTYSMPLNTTTVNGQECYISTETEPNSSLGYPAIILFLIVSLVHTFHTMYRPENKKMNYFLYCLSTAVNLFTVPWTWYAWDYCYSLLPSYSGSLGSIYKYLYIVDCGCAGIIFLAWMAVLFLGLNGGCAFVTTMLAICVMALVGFFYKIMTYLQLALRFYPKLVIVFDLVFHIHFVASAFIPYFKSKLKL